MSAQLRTRAEATSRSPSPFTPVHANLLRRKCACGGTPGPSGECAECRKNRLQRQAMRQTEPDTVPPIVHDVLRSPGQPLDVATRSFMEQRFGHDFGRVRVHADPKAAESTLTVNAIAYAVGHDLVFGAGRYAPGTGEGCRLLAHELTHVVQQGAGVANRNAGLVLDQPNNAFEREARGVAESIEALGAPESEAKPNANDAPSPYSAAGATVRRQLVTPLGPGGGFGGLMERDRRRAAQPQQPPPAAVPRAAQDVTCDIQLCFLPLEVLLERGVSPELAYATANHAYLRWDGQSAGFTRLTGESISDARVIVPEPR